MRKAMFSGKYYKEGFDALNKQIEKAFEYGPGDLPVRSREKKVRGVIVPQANYLVSGGVAAWAYKEIAESRFPELYIVIGSAGGSGSGDGAGDKVYLSLEDFETPFGVVKNAGLVSKNENVVVDEGVHAEEKGIEMQLPFLQYVSRDKLDKLRVMPLLVGRKCRYDVLVKVAKAINSIEKEFVVVGGADFTKYGDRFNYIPFRYNVQEEIKNLDMRAVRFVRDLDVEGFLEYGRKIRISGNKVIALVLEIVKRRCEKGRLLEYGDSGRVTGYDNYITYGSFVF